MKHLTVSSRSFFLVHFALLVVSILIASLSLEQALAQWSNNPNTNTAISTAVGGQYYPTITSDGAGGAIITWYDYRSGLYTDIYAQRISASGVVQWDSNGVAISTAAGNQVYPVITGDGAGGAIITWYEGLSDIYAQRINGSGVVQWIADGVAISTAAGSQQYPTIVGDGAGGAIITWYDLRSGPEPDIYAQRVNASGVVQWDSNGVAISTAASGQYNPVITGDGAEGAIITWHDLRSGLPNVDIYAQRINGSGVVQWDSNGVAISTAANSQYEPRIVSDGAGGAIITWYDLRSGTNADIYAQRINGSGVVQWIADGVAISTEAGNQGNPAIVSDGAGGAIITWYDSRSDPNGDLYAQRINGSGVVQWIADGVAISTAAGGQNYPTITSDSAGGAIITWYDLRSGLYKDIYAQRVNASGIVQWTANGVAISTAAGDQDGPTITGDGAGGAIITWYDLRSGPNPDIYAQRIVSYGTLGKDARARILSILDVLNDQGGNVRVRWQKSPYDTAGTYQQIASYGLWRRIPPMLAAQKISGKTMKTQDDTLGLYDFIVTVPAVQLPAYSVVSPTLADSSASGIHRFTFLVTAHTSDPNVFFISRPDSGYSVDNLPPVAPLNLTGNIVGNTVVLHWNPNTERDLAGYEVYRSLMPNFDPDTMTAYATTIDTSHTDVNVSPGITHYYALRALDVHGNRSPKSNEVSIILVGLGSDVPRIPTEFALHQNYPNPFNPGTTIRYDLPITGHVTLKIYDVLGRVVVTLVDGVQEAGYNSVRFEVSNLPSGIYLYRIIAGSYNATKKLMVVK